MIKYQNLKNFVFTFKMINKMNKFKEFKKQTK